MTSLKRPTGAGPRARPHRPCTPKPGEWRASSHFQHSATGRALGGVSGCTGSPFWGPILYSGMALAATSTPSVRIVGRRARAEAPRGSEEARHGSRQTRLPVEAIEKTLDVLVVERQRLHEKHSGPEPLEANRLAIVYWQRELAEARRSTSASA